MRTLWILATAVIAMVLAAGCAAQEEPGAADEIRTQHMVAEAKLTAHYIAAALEAGKTPEEINATLAEIANSTVIDEFWISDEGGNVEFTTSPGTGFKFPTDPKAGTQAAPFAELLLGSKDVVAQGVEAREFDGRPFQYVGVAGVDKPRIVQVGLEGPER